MSKKKETIKKLARKAIEEKWSKRESEIMSNCSFCDYTPKHKGCDKCLIPKILCGYQNKMDLITKIALSTDGFYIFEADSYLVDLMRRSLLDLATRGKLTKDIETEIREVLDES
jgi:hypothetical protein